jgi:hypothetical protein
MDILCVLHDGDEYGICRWPLDDVARAAGVTLRLAKELAQKLVLKGADSGPVAYTHVRSHAGKDEPMVLLDTTGPCWFSSRMVTDEWRRSVRGKDTRLSPEEQPNQSPKPPIGDGSGYGPSSSSSSSSADKKKEDSAPQADAAPKPVQKTMGVKTPRPEHPDFAVFFEAFPRHESRDHGARAYDRVIARGADPEDLLAGAKRYAAHVSASTEDRKFVRLPATWLDKGCWRDEYESGPPAAVATTLPELRAQKAKAEKLGIPTAKLDRAIQELSGVAA